jgi:hypothetical protein
VELVELELLDVSATGSSISTTASGREPVEGWKTAKASVLEAFAVRAYVLGYYEQPVFVPQSRHV